MTDRPKDTFLDMPDGVPAAPPLDLILFDLDGTLIESLAVKDGAFQALYADADCLNDIMAYHRSHNHVVRFEKFHHISERFFGVPLDDAEDARLRDRFSALAADGLIACPEVAGARMILDHYHGRVPMALISRSPDAELRRVLKARGLDNYFEQIYSADWAKAVAIADALKRWNVTPERTAYIGDAPEDAAVSLAAGLHFIGRESGRGLDGGALPVFADMHGVLGHLRKSFATAPSRQG